MSARMPSAPSFWYALACATASAVEVEATPFDLDAVLSRCINLVAEQAAAKQLKLVLRNEVVFGTVNAAKRHYGQAAAALAKADNAWLARLLTKRVPLTSWSDALVRGPDDVKVVIELQA